MKSEYLTYLEQEEGLSQFSTEEEVERFKKLTPYQAELLVLYLKNKDDKQVSRNFPLILDDLQKKYAKSSSQKRIMKLFFIGVALCVFSGVILSGLILSSSFDSEYLKVVLLLLFMGTLGLATHKCLIPLIDAAEKQGRNHLIQSIRVAQNCGELDQAGLFQHDEEQEIVRILRKSLYVDSELAYTKKGGARLEQP